MREWPSIVPGTPEDYYIVINHYGQFGTAFAETDLDRANYETTIADLMSGQHCDPLRVVMFNPETNRAEDVSYSIAQEILRRLGLEGRNEPPELEDFIDRHVGRDRQLTLRLALTDDRLTSRTRAERPNTKSNTSVVGGRSRSTVIITIGNALGTNPKIAIGLLSPVGLLFALPVLLWAFSFTERFGLEKCSIGSISGAEYQNILSRAGAQRWTVWPGLSNGVFWPSDSGFRGPTASFNSNLNDQLLSHIRELAGSDPSINRQLASAHTVLRSMGAEYVQTQEVPDMRGDRADSRVYFTYYLPQVRFAPACVLCLVWWYTAIDVIFSHELATDRYELQAVNVLHAGLKGSPDKNIARNVPWGSCPEFRRSFHNG